MRLGYNTNGLPGIDIVEAVEELEQIGYRALALTLDHDALSPFGTKLEQGIAAVKEALDSRSFGVVVETGARFLLDSRVKHEPTLVSRSRAGRARRIDFLKRATDIAKQLGADCVSLWSGAVRDEVGDREAMDRLTSGLGEVIRHASESDVVIAFEPEPDMFIDTMNRYGDLRNELERQKVPLSHFRLTVDVGHLHCQGEVPIDDVLRAWGDQIANIHIEDMRAGIHEHLMFGEGEIDFPPVIAALGDIGYTGMVNVELSRHGHLGMTAARQAFEFLHPLFERQRCSSL